MSTYVIGLDFGGGGGRCLLLDLHANETTVAARRWRFAAAPGTSGLGFDVDLGDVWRKLGEATREALERAGATPDQVLGVAATALRLGNVFVDEAGAPLLAVPNRDARAAGPGMLLGAEHGEALYAATGRWPYPIHAAARLQWMQSERPDDFARIADVLSISDWLAFRLSGERATDPTQAGESLLFDLETRSWSDEWIDRLGLPRRIFPTVREPGERLGSLAPDAAEHLGLCAGIPVAVGAGDTQCALLGAGATAPGEVVAVAGTTGPIQRVVDAPLFDGEQRLWTGHHAVAGQWVLESNCGPLGEVLDWLARLLHPDARLPVARLLGEARQSSAGARGLVSSLGAEVMNARAMGLPVGHLTLSHLTSADEPAPRHHLARAVLEGMACALRANLEQIDAVAGAERAALVLTGGLSASPTFAQIVCDVLGAPLRTTATPSTTALGAAMCAAVGAGLQPDLPAAAAAYAEPPAERTPDGATESTSIYTRWTALRQARSAADAEAATLVMPYAVGGGASGGEDAGLHRPRVLVAADFDDRALARLEAIADVTYAPFRKMKRMLTGQALVDALADYDVFVTEIDLVDVASLEQLPGLRVVASCRGDAVNVDVDACTAFGIPVLNTPGRNADAVADLALAFMLMLARKLPTAERFLHAPGIAPGDMGAMGKAFGTLQGRELWQKTVGLIGLGAVGRKVAERLRGFGVRLLVHDPFIDAEQAALSDAEAVPLETLLRESDFVSLHAAVTPETTGLLGFDELALMKRGAFLVNTARAALVDEEALVTALADERIAGAALDTFSVEPPGSDHPFMAMAHVISTPHVGGNTTDVAAHQGEIVVDDLERLLAGDAPRFALNPEVLDTFSFAAPRPEPTPDVIARLKEGPAPAVTDLQKKEKKDERRESKKPAAPTPSAPSDPAPASTAAAAPPAAVRDHMRRLLEAFLARATSDPGMAAFAEDKDVTLHFTLDDLDLAFHLHLGPGEALAGAIGDPAENADVQLRLRAGVLDGMFTGTANPMEAAMDGRLSFTGDAAKAMTLQQMQTDLERLYQAARGEVGAPEGLDALAATAAAPAPAGAEDVRADIVATVGELYDAQLITATGGNVSARGAQDDQVWITPSRLFKGDLAPEVMVRIDLGGRSLDPGARSPSSEWDMHCAIYRAKPQARAVIHAHAPNATILANTGLPFLPISTEAAFFGDLPRVPFIMPGTPELAEATAAAMGDGWAALLVNHGLIVAGRSLRSAADMVEIIERTAEVLLGCHAVGAKPPVLPDDVVKTLREMGDLVA